MIGIAWFWLSFIILGLIQPGYQPIRDTISLLAVGPMGWIQVFNFLILALISLVFGLGLSLSFFGRLKSQITTLSACISLGVLNLIFFPADRRDSIKDVIKNFSSVQSAVHFFTAISLALIMICLAVVIWRQLSAKSDWQHLQKTTFWLMSIGTLGGFIWVCGRFTGFTHEWKGLLQKTLVTDIFIWLWLMSKQLTHLPNNSVGAD
jgi:hypothetical protein